MNCSFETEFNSNETSHGFDTDVFSVFKKRHAELSKAYWYILEFGKNEIPAFKLENFYRSCERALGEVKAGGYAKFLDSNNERKVEKIKKDMQDMISTIEEAYGKM